MIRAREAWQVTTGVPSVRIGMVDTGLYLDHPDFAGQLAVNAAEDLNGNGASTPATSTASTTTAMASWTT